MSQNQLTVITTEHKIGKITYFVSASSSETATDTIEKKMKKLLKKDIQQLVTTAK